MKKLAAAAAVLTTGALLAGSSAPAPSAVRRAAASPSECSRAMPAGIAVPAGNDLAFGLDAEGVQVYACTRASGAAEPAWTLQAPDATLADAGGAPAGKHGAGPTWEALDGSSVAGAKVASVDGAPGAVPWLLLRASSHAGAGRMADVSFVQRIATAGGVAPREGCGASTVGAVVRVPYRAVYCFHHPAGARP